MFHDLLPHLLEKRADTIADRYEIAADGWPPATEELVARESYWVQRANQTNAYAKRKGAEGVVEGVELRGIWTGFCHYCECRIALGTVRRGFPLATIDHVQNMAGGGTNTIDNIVWACKKCNQEKA